MLDTRWYTLKEAAERLRISTKTLSGILKQHPHCARVGRKFIISDADLMRLYEVLKAECASANPTNIQNARVRASPSDAKVYARLAKLTAKPKPTGTASTNLMHSKRRQRGPRSNST